MRLTVLLTAALLLPLAAMASEDLARVDFDATLAKAKAQNKPVLLDFHAPWCHSCYFMEKHVLNGPEWESFTRSSLVVPLDTDTPEGTLQKLNYKLLGVPTYILVDANGKEMGRIVGDMPRAQFYKELSGISGKGRGLLALQTRALGKGESANTAALGVLRHFHNGLTGTAGLSWWASLPEARRNKLAALPAFAHELDWLQLLAASEAKPADAAVCTRLAPSLLELDRKECRLGAGLSLLNHCLAELPAEQRAAVLSPFRPALEALVETKVIADPPQCSDNRDPVLLAVELARLDGDEVRAQKLLSAAIEHGNEQLAKNGLLREKSIADNQRVFLEAAGRWDALNTLLAQLIAAYPDDYVYANRYARALAAQGQHERALEWFEKASAKCYGVNRLRNAQEQVKSLMALGRTDQAKSLVDTVLTDNGPWFEEDVAKLKALVA